jgi:hypothetical protein
MIAALRMVVLMKLLYVMITATVPMILVILTMDANTIVSVAMMPMFVQKILVILKLDVSTLLLNMTTITHVLMMIVHLDMALLIPQFHAMITMLAQKTGVIILPDAKMT